MGSVHIVAARGVVVISVFVSMPLSLSSVSRSLSTFLCSYISLHQRPLYSHAENRTYVYGLHMHDMKSRPRVFLAN